MYTPFGLYWNGMWQKPASGKSIPVISPVTEEVLGEAPAANKSDTRKVVESAVSGTAQWRKVIAWERSRMLRRVAEVMRERTDDMSRWLSLELGKPLDQSKGEVGMAIEQFEWYAEEAKRIYGHVLESRQPHGKVLIQHEPLGVVAAFTSWNFPVVLAARKIAPALAAGCSVILRPAEEAPGSAMLLVQCLHEAGVPAGVINLINGSADTISPVLLNESRVRKISLTGSARVGKLLIKASAETLKRTSMELGGHAPVIIYADADAEAIAEQAALVKFKHCGQVCASPSRYFIHESQAESFTNKFIEIAQNFKLGNGMESGIDIGPLATKKRLKEVELMVSGTLKSGARLRLGGKRPEGFDRGFFYEPTVFDQVPDHAPIMQEEPFGPLVPITTFRYFDEVIERANSLEYGLTSYAFTRSQRLAHDTADALEAGMVAVNTFALASAETPYGGIKQSGFGREGGSQGIHDYLNIKYINMVMEE